MDLLRRSLCEDSADYESLIANMSIVMSTVDCDESGNFVVTQPGALILADMFNSADGFWWNTGGAGSCFSNRNVYYYNKPCGQEAVTYEPASGSDPCAVEAKCISRGGPSSDATFAANGGAGDIGITVDVQGSGSVAEETSFVETVVPTANEYVIMHTHCNLLQYVFHFGTEPVVAGTDTYVQVLTITVAGLVATIIAQADFVAGVTGDVATIVVADVATSFADIANLYAEYLGQLDATDSLENVQKVMLSLCALLKNRIAFDRVLNKTMLTIGKCDL